MEKFLRRRQTIFFFPRPLFINLIIHSYPYVNDFIDFFLPFCMFFSSSLIVLLKRARWFIRNLTLTTSLKLVDGTQKKFRFFFSSRSIRFAQIKNNVSEFYNVAISHWFSDWKIAIVQAQIRQRQNSCREWKGRNRQIIHSFSLKLAFSLARAA